MQAFSPMLAQAGRVEDVERLTSSDEYLFDLKIDGVRATIAIMPGNVVITNRNGVNTTDRYPDLVTEIKRAFRDVRLVLDGEIVVLNEDGKPDFSLTARRDRQSDPVKIDAIKDKLPATFIAFDLLYVGNQDYRDLPLVARRNQLHEIITAQPSKRIQEVLSSHNGDVMLDLVRSHKLEGLIAKRKASTYQGGRRPAWLKIKPTKSVTCAVTGYTRGTGHRSSTFGALEVALVDSNGSLKSMGEVGTGFKAKDLEEITDYFKNPSTPLVIEVEYLEVTNDGKFRFPVYRGIRTDKDVKDCVDTQLSEFTISEQPVVL